ncbi:hypothetical protein DTO282F9_6452 [Paecilomyces variotii]|nr:hypothetical protein DTO027B9_7097 [Paecilomyces variotii]KAJ9368865.1 hypothetical protein DTO282E5_6465 [Paecilomyces variotii]KAJ9396632.1 hypothetical protein DTO282F9_6452 [Paecilomyces variotii]
MVPVGSESDTSNEGDIGLAILIHSYTSLPLFDLFPYLIVQLEIQTRSCSVGLEDPRTRIGASPSTSRAYWIRPFGRRTWDAG